MKPFSNAPCPKCGGKEIAVGYEPGFGKSVPPYMRRTCRECCYGWNEAPLDATPEPLAIPDAVQPSNFAPAHLKEENLSERDKSFGQLAFESYHQDASHLTWPQCSEAVKDRWQRVGEHLFNIGRAYEQEHREKRWHT